MRHLAAIILSSSLLTAVVAWAAGAEPGERLFREGLTISGEPVQATVVGDLPVSGAAFACVACHGRSGMGSVGGNVIAAPIIPAFLDHPHAVKSRTRPPYSPELLARAIREGVDSGGNRLDPMMPHYKLGDADLAALLAYLETLSIETSPGASTTELHFATVVTPGAPALARTAMLEVIQAYFAAKNSSARTEHSAKWILHVWDLKGAPESWPAQLEARYRERPAFALVSGLGPREWAPLHKFCEVRRIPCILPNVDTPPTSGSDYYSVYFSAGADLEARVIASRIKQQAAPHALQIFRSHGVGARSASTLAAAVAIADLELQETGPIAPALVQQKIRESGATTIVLWLDRASLAPLVPALGGHEILISATVFGGDLAAARALGLKSALFVDSAAPATDGEARFQHWLASTSAKISPKSDRRIVDQTFFALTVLGQGVTQMKSNLYRDYLLESLDHFAGLDALSAYYPHLSFGPGQRLLSKGCSLTPLDGTAAPEWAVP